MPPAAVLQETEPAEARPSQARIAKAVHAKARTAEAVPAQAGTAETRPQVLPEADLLCSKAVVCRSGQAKLCVSEEACVSAIVCGSVQAGVCSEGSDLCCSVQAQLRGPSSVTFSRWLIAVPWAGCFLGQLVFEFV